MKKKKLAYNVGPYDVISVCNSGCPCAPGVSVTSYTPPYKLCCRVVLSSHVARFPSGPAMNVDHSQTCEPRKMKPPTTVHESHLITPRLSIRWPASTASTMVTELTMRINV